MSADPRADAEYLDSNAVAERLGIKRATLYVYASRGTMPEPDLVWLGRNLWLVSTIDAWRADWYKRGRVRISRRERHRASKAYAQRRLPPKVAAVKRRSIGPALEPVSEQVAKRVAAELRGEGHYCTSADVLELAGLPGDTELERERELLLRRIVSKLRGGAGAEGA